MCADMIELRKAKTRIIELEEELKFTCDGYEEEIKTLLEKNDDLVEKIGIFMGGPVPKEDLISSGQLHHHRRHRLGFK